MKNQKLLPFLANVTLVVIIASIFCITSCSKKTDESETKTLKIGGSMPLSGPPSAAGIAWKQGWELAAEKINNEGGLKIGDTTYKIELMVEDSKASAEGGTTAVTKLVHEEGARFIMGDTADFMIPPIYKVTSEGGALFCVSMLASSKDIPGSIGDMAPDKPLLIRTMPATSEFDIIPIKYMLKNYPHVKRVALIALAFPDYDGLSKKYASDWAPLGLKITCFERVSPDTIDFNPIITRLLATKPDAIDALRVTPNQIALIVKTARDAGFNGPIIYPPPLDPEDTVSPGAKISDVITCGVPMDDPNLPDSIKEVIQLGRAKYGAKNFVEDAILGYDQVILLSQILQKAESVDPAKVIKTFEGLKNKGDLQSIFGPAYVGGLQKTGVNRVLVRPSPLSHLVNGKGEYIGMVTVDIP